MDPTFGPSPVPQLPPWSGPRAAEPTRNSIAPAPSSAAVTAPSEIPQRPVLAWSDSQRALCPDFDAATTVPQQRHASPRQPNTSKKAQRIASCRLYLRRSFQAPLLNLHLAHLELLNLSGHRHRKSLHKANELGNLEMRDLPLAMLADLVFRARL